jgi:hypothetical protein
MSSTKRKSVAFRQRDIQRAVRAAQVMGLPVSGFEIDKDGKISIKTAPAGEQQQEPNPWDSAHAEDKKRASKAL